MGWFNINTELKIFKSGNSQAISIKKKTMEKMGLKIGDRLNIEKRNDEMILTKKEEKNFEEEWHEFFKNGHSYHNLEETDWGEEQGREIW